MRLLIVDDHEILRRTLRLFVQQYDDLIVVGEAADGNEALELCARAHPDIVLIDIYMPQMDGVTATRAIHAAYPDIQVIGMTGYRSRDNVAATLAAGAIACLDKLDVPAHLIPTIRNSLHAPAA